MIFRRQLITAATAIVTVLSLCCLVATEAHTLSDAIVPEATSDTADLLVLADQYSDTADLLTDAASWEKRALAAESSENKLKIELRREQAEVTRLKDAALHPALVKPVGSTGRTPASHVDSVESNSNHLVDKTTPRGQVESTADAAAIGTAIPLHSVNSINGWQPLTYVSIGSGTPIPVLVDTGSQIMAVCPQTDAADSTSVPGEYACKMYGKTTQAPIGWEGQYRSAKVTFGKGTQITADSYEMKFGQIESDSDAGICSKEFSGILGASLGTYDSYTTKLQSIVKGRKWAGCCGNSGTHCAHGTTSLHQQGQFEKTMLTSANERAMAFIGVTQDDAHTPGVLAFGATAHTMLNQDKRIGSLQLVGGTGYYSFKGSVTFRIKGWAEGCKHMTDMAPDCSYTWIQTKSAGPNPYLPLIDSGSQRVDVPSKFWDSILKATKAVNINPAQANHKSPPRSATMEMSFENSEAKLEFPDFFSKAFESNSLYPKLGGNWFRRTEGVPRIGFSAFWEYDFLFQLNPDYLAGVTHASAVIGTLGIYGR